MPEIISNLSPIGLYDTRKNISPKNKTTNVLAKNENKEQNLNVQPSNVLGKSIVFKGKKESFKNSPDTNRFGRYQNMSDDELNSEIQKRAIEEEKNNKYCSYEFQYMMELENPNAKRAALTFLENGVSSHYALSFVQNLVDDDEINSVVDKFFDLHEDIGIPSNCIFDEFVHADDKKYSDIRLLLEKYGTMSASDIRDLSRMPSSLYEKIKSRVLDDNIPLSDIMLLAIAYRSEDELNERINKFDELNSEFNSSSKAASLALMYEINNPDKYNLALKLNEQGFDVNDATALAELDDTTRERVFTYLDRFNVSDAISIAKSKYPEKLLSFIELGTSVYQAERFLDKGSEEETDEILQTLKSLVNDKDKKYDTKTAILLADLPKDKLEKAKKYFAICQNIQLAIKYAKDDRLSPAQQGYVEELLNCGYYYGADEIAKSPNAEKVLADFRKKDGELKNILSSDNEFSYENLTGRDKYYLTTYGFDSPYYSPNEYVHQFLTYKNMQTKDGYHIFNTEHFQRKNTEDFSEMQSALNDGMLYNNLVRALRLDPKGEEFDYFSKYLDLMREGLINPSAIRALSAANIQSKDNSFTRAGIWSISPNMKKDIDTYYDTKNNSTSADFEKNLALAFVPDFKTESEAINSLNIGDTFKLPNEKFIRIVAEDNKTEQLNISRGTYLKLFPPLQRFSTSQQILGDCYCLETFMGMFNDDRMRQTLLQAISENENGDITIKFPNKDMAVTYEKGELPKGQNPETYSCGANGFKLFEHAYSLVLIDDEIKSAQALLKGKKLDEFNEFISQNKNSKDGIFIYIKYDEPHWTTFNEAVNKKLHRQKGKFDAAHYDAFNQYLLGDGSNEAKVFSLFNMKSDIYEREIESEKDPNKHLQSVKRYQQLNSKYGFNNVMSYDKLKDDIKQVGFFDENIVSVGMNNHAYNLSKAVDLKGNTAYYLYNPHNQALPIKFDDVDLLTEFLCLNAKSVLITKRKQD